MLPKGCVQADGSLLVTSSDPEGTATEDIIYVNGLPVNNLGQLLISTEPIVSYAMGLPFDAALWQVDNTLTGHRDRAKALLYSYMIIQSDDAYWFHTASTRQGVTTLSEDISESTTSIDISVTTGFHTGTGVVAIGEELITYTSLSGNTLLGCTRGVMGTTASTHSNGDAIEDVQRTFGERNTFRSSIKWLCFAYDWLYNSLTSGERLEIGKKFKLYGKYWADWTDAANDFAELVDSGRDSDENTMVAEAFLLMGISLYADDAYSDTLLGYSDVLLTNKIVGEYLNGNMAGGIWGEGPEYSAGTIPHWVMSYLINNEVRGIAYPSSAHISNTIKGWMQLTLPNNTGIYMYDDVQGVVSDYLPMQNHERFSMMSLLEGASDIETDRSLVRNWKSRAIEKEGQPNSTTSYTGIFRLLFEEPAGSSTAPTSETVPLAFYSPGLNFFAQRTDWTDSASVIYSYSRLNEYDHIHKVAGHFDIVDSGVYITKEVTGYENGPVSPSGASHNMVLIENRVGGGALGTYTTTNATTVRHTSTDNYGYIEYDLKGLFKFSFYLPETPVTHNSRKLLFVKPNTLFVLDKIDISESSDCSWNGVNNQGSNVPCLPRYKRLYQHFQAEPVLSSGVYSATSEGKTLWFKSLLPLGSTITAENEKIVEPWASAATEDVPVNQRKWHLKIEPATETSPSETFLSVLHWGDAGSATMGVTEKLASTGALTVQSGEVVGVFSEDNGLISSASYTADAIYHYVADLPINTSISITRAGTAVPGSPFDSGGAGIIEFTTTSGSSDYVVMAGDVVIPPDPVPGTKHPWSFGGSSVKWTVAEP